MKYPITETFYKNNSLYCVMSQHVDDANVYQCNNVLDSDDVLFLTREQIESLIDVTQYEANINKWLSDNPQVGKLNSGKFYVIKNGGMMYIKPFTIQNEG